MLDFFFHKVLEILMRRFAFSDNLTYRLTLEDTVAKLPFFFCNTKFFSIKKVVAIGQNEKR